MKLILPFILFLLLSTLTVCAQESLSSEQTKRIGTLKVLLKNVEGRSVDEIAKDLRGTSFPEGNLQIMEAIAQTYHDVVREHEAADADRKKWLYSMVQLNMAYFQFEGVRNNRKDTSLNILIRRKLIQYLSPDLLKDPRLIHTLE